MIFLIVLFLLLFPLPIFIINIMIGISMVYSIVAFFVIRANKGCWEIFSKIVFELSLFMLALCIQSCRSVFIANTIEEQNPILQLFPFNYGVAIIIAICIIIVMNIFIVKKFEQISDGLMTIEESIKILDMDMFSGCVRWICGTIKAVCFMYFINLISGTIIGIMKLSLVWKEAMSVYANLALAGLFVFSLPLIIITFAIKIHTTVCSTR